jgi:hypothetical protein
MSDADRFARGRELPNDFFLKALHEVWSRDAVAVTAQPSPARLDAFRASRECLREDSMRRRAPPETYRARSK